MGFNEDLIVHFRKNRGVITEGPFTGRDVLLLTTTGASSGQPRTHPLVYMRDGDQYLIIASKGGAPTHPAWYHNLREHPEVIVEVDRRSSRRGPPRSRADPGAAGCTTTPRRSTRASRNTSRRRRARSPRCCWSASILFGDLPPLARGTRALRELASRWR
jgi:deazaflavin-dependent oxidoreductase (nitroreductase family)